jgi:hypothetical protein
VVDLREIPERVVHGRLQQAYESAPTSVAAAEGASHESPSAARRESPTRLAA